MRAGTRALRRTVEAAPDLGVSSLAVYAFSTENWGRPADEVDELMTLFADTIEREFPDLHRQGVRVRFLGRRDRCPESLRELMEDMEARTAGNTRLDLWVAFDYGSRDEIVGAARALVEAGTEPAAIDEDAVRAHLYAPEMPDPDLVIRTSGEVRVSNFLLWQSAYAELEFVPTLWPDFGARRARRGARRPTLSAGAASVCGERSRLAHRRRRPAGCGRDLCRARTAAGCWWRSRRWRR